MKLSQALVQSLLGTSGMPSGEDCVFTTPFALAAEPDFLFSRAALGKDYLVLAGARLSSLWRGVYRREIPLEAIQKVRWIRKKRRSRKVHANLALSLSGGSHLRLWVNSPGAWESEIEKQIRRRRKRIRREQNSLPNEKQKPNERQNPNEKQETPEP